MGYLARASVAVAAIHDLEVGAIRVTNIVVSARVCPFVAVGVDGQWVEVTGG